MTAATARRVPARRGAAKPARQPARPPLRVVTPVPSRAPRAPFVLFSLLLVGSGLVALLYLNTAVAQDAFAIHDLDRGTAALAEREQRLLREIADLEAPHEIAAKARDLGLVPAGDPVFVAPDGKVLGRPVPATTPAPARPAAPAATQPPATPAATKPAPASAKPSGQPSAQPGARRSKPAKAAQPGKPGAKPSPAPSAEPTP